MALRVEMVSVTGLQAEVPITGNHARRIIHGALNVKISQTLWG
jgi:hypothetical protein